MLLIKIVLTLLRNIWQLRATLSVLVLCVNDDRRTLKDANSDSYMSLSQQKQVAKDIINVSSFRRLYFIMK